VIAVLGRIDGVDGMATLEVLDPTTCAGVADRVLARRDCWRSRALRGTFFTLGVNAYMDLAPSDDPSSSYDVPATATNAELLSQFPDVYDALAGTLAVALGMPVRYADDLALPGFHVWVGAGIPREPVASVHFDLQYRRIVARPEYTRATGTLSFTLPVRLPAAGSSLRVWPDARYPAWSGRAAAELPEPVVLPYTVGVALVHTGHVLHQIGVTPVVIEDDVRITLQGHGLVIDDELVCYW
jgi:hypothetical protein